MGLDMYLTKKTYVKNWQHMKPKELHEVSVKKGGKDTAIKPERVRDVVEEVAYWRKANQIHEWFVKHVQSGKDDCGEYYVTTENLEELLATINKVLESCELVDGQVSNGYHVEKDEKGELKRVPIMVDGKYIKDSSIAHTLLPAADGFFFGSTDYDEYYVQDLEYTKKVLTELLVEEGGGDYYYSSSW